MKINNIYYIPELNELLVCIYSKEIVLLERTHHGRCYRLKKVDIPKLWKIYLGKL